MSPTEILGKMYDPNPLKDKIKLQFNFVTLKLLQVLYDRSLETFYDSFYLLT